MQEETLSILRSLGGQVEEIAAALQAAQVELRGETTADMQAGTDYLMGELTMLVVMLTGTDSDVAARELEVMNAMRQVVYGHEAASLGSNDYLELCREFLHLHPESRMTVDHLPSSIRLLLAYDQKRGTDYASKARTLFAQFGDALVKADNNEHPMEAIILANFKDVLNRMPDNEP